MFYDFLFKNIIIFSLLLIFIVSLIIIEIYNFFESKHIISVIDALKLINENKAVILDLRTFSDFKKCHIINSINLPLNILEHDIELLNKYRNKTIVIIYYNNKSFKNIYSNVRLTNNYIIKYFKYGLQEWIDKDMPVIRTI